MRGLTWLLGVFVILLGYEGGNSAWRGWAAVWTSAAVLWFFVGCVLGVYALSRVASAKMAGRVGGVPGHGAIPNRTADREKRDDG